MRPVQLNLIDPLPSARVLPRGFEYRPALIAPDAEAELIARFRDLPLREFEFHGFLGKRRTVSFGWRYDFADGKMHRAEAIPAFLRPLREYAAAFVGLAPAAIEHALVTEYTPSAAIGWHRDRAVFGDVIGVSFGSACRFRFRRPLPNPPPLAGDGGVGASRSSSWERATFVLEPRSAYLLRGPARDEWEHSIPPSGMPRYSVTFRTIRDR